MITKDTLAQFELFRDVPAEVLELIAEIAQDVFVQKGHFVFREGEKAEHVHLLVNGSIALRVQLTSKPAFVTVSIVAQPYQTLGWSGLVPPHHYTASAYCEEDTHLIAIPAQPLLEILANHPEAGFKVMLRVTEIIADRLRNSRQALLKTL